MPTNSDVRVRMYRQGLGDCFLLTFPRQPEPFHMLIDCGALKSKHYGAKEMKDVVRDVHKATGGRLDVLAVTHEHWDHVSGFADAKDVFDTFEVEKVWAGWTEQPGHPAADVLRERFKKRKKAVEMALARLPEAKVDKVLGLYKKAIGELLGFYGGLGAAATTGDAWAYALKKGKGKPVYCDPKKKPLELPELPGVRFYVLGPPEDPEFVKKLLSKKETYNEVGFSFHDSLYAALAGRDADPDGHAQSFPFDERSRIAPARAKRDAFFAKRYGFGRNGGGGWRRIDDDWLAAAGELALHLDSYTNNTCLALAIEIVATGQVLLFPGDAQVGNWLSWGGLSWKVKNSEGKMVTVKSDDLLSRTVLYKVGHHGSHNATLREKGLEKMTSEDLVALIPVHRKTAEDQEWEFPYQPLWDRLKERAKGRVLLADMAGFQEIEAEAKKHLTNDEWKAFKARTDLKPLYVEYRLKA